MPNSLMCFQRFSVFKKLITTTALDFSSLIHVNKLDVSLATLPKLAQTFPTKFTCETLFPFRYICLHVFQVQASTWKKILLDRLLK